MPAILALLEAVAENATDQSGSDDQSECEEHGKPIDRVPASETERDEPCLDDQVRRPSAHDSVAQWRAGALSPRCAAAAEHEAEYGAEEEQGVEGSVVGIDDNVSVVDEFEKHETTC